MYEVIAKGGPGGNFLYITARGTVVSIQTTMSPDDISEKFSKVPTVKYYDDAVSILETLNLEAAAETQW